MSAPASQPPAASEAARPARCAALLVTAPASGQGKTMLTAALARTEQARGQRVRVFKVGADFIDPMILERASGAPVYQLDIWMGGEAHCRALLAEAAAQADLILVEGAMGLYDGAPSSADLARSFGLPVLAVIDAGAMAQTFGALAHGLATYQPGLRMAGVVANRVAGPGHVELLERSLPAGMALVASVPHVAHAALPERHLGLTQPDEVADLAARIARLAAQTRWHGEAGWPSVSFGAATPAPVPRLLDGVRIALAADAAFSFVYRANLDTLAALGATVVPFSPLADAVVPPADALYLPGGYPELHLPQLSANATMLAALRGFCAAGRPVLAECGGMMVLLEAIAAVDGARAAMAGVLPGQAAMQPGIQALALQQAELPEGALRGHTFHCSRLATSMQPAALGRCPNGGRTREAVFRSGRVTASYVHWYFPSNPAAVAALLRP